MRWPDRWRARRGRRELRAHDPQATAVAYAALVIALIALVLAITALSV